MTVLRWVVPLVGAPAVIWPLLTDFDRMPAWFLGVRRVELLGAAPAEGVERVLTLVLGSHLERIGHWDPPRSFSIVVLHPPFFARDWRGDIALEAHPGGALLRWELRYSPRFGRAGRLLDHLLVRPALNLAFTLSLRRFAALTRARAERAD